MRPALRAKKAEDEVGEPVDDYGLPVEAWSRVNHPEDARPARDAAQATWFSLQTLQDGKACEPGGDVGLLLGDFGANLAERGYR